MDQIKLPDPPKGWGQDRITHFLDNTRLNSFATFANLTPDYASLQWVDAAFRKLIDNLVNTRDWFAAFFLLRAHSSFLAGAHLAMAGQVAEAYATLRLSLENGLYGFYMARNPSSQEVWLRRHDSDDAKRRVRSEFTYRKLLAALAKASAEEATTVGRLYDHTIDYGAHPNERSLTLALRTTKRDDRIEFDIVYLTADIVTLRACLRVTAQVGTSILAIFRLIFAERFDLIGLGEALDALKM